MHWTHIDWRAIRVATVLSQWRRPGRIHHSTPVNASIRPEHSAPAYGTIVPDRHSEQTKGRIRAYFFVDRLTSQQHPALHDQEPVFSDSLARGLR